ncbi:hypothetical protein K458DRAFT_15322 [Lentithecium fluviatile CBS 122367]|uniref:Uncharacterized protein n=1 Tax=Lentithecium fluviatile CBS 122367 TaxID=1168545 RepID=A0A6G1J537_9PLEO|nr:hypothetical protein K458DRAFT_15322 [Lentithecium fluviatile CBS 122367]
MGAGDTRRTKVERLSTLWKSALRDDGTTVCAFRLPNMRDRYLSVQAFYKEQAGDFRSVIDRDYPEVRQSPFTGFYGKRVTGTEWVWDGVLLKTSGQQALPVEAFGNCKRTESGIWQYWSEAFQTFNQPCDRVGGCQDYRNWVRQGSEASSVVCGCEEKWYRRCTMGKGKKVNPSRLFEFEDPKLPPLNSLRVYTTGPDNGRATICLKSGTSESDSISLFSDDARERAATPVLEWVREQVRIHEYGT